MEDKYTTFWSRLYAGFIDGLILLPLTIADIFLVRSESIVFVISWIIIYELSFIIYSVYFHGICGQTIGKKVAKIKVIDVNEAENISFKQAFLRDSVLLATQIFYLYNVINITLDKGYYSESLLDGLPLFLANLVTLWIVIELLTMLSNRKRRALHDYIAGTVVIKTKAIPETGIA